MNNIIIVGTGKAAYLHYLKYKKIGIENIYFLDKTITNNNIPSELVVQTIDDILEKMHYITDYAIVDVCTPRLIFEDIINQFIKNSFTNFIVEKPFIVNNKYSKISIKIKELIESKGLKIKQLKINFSKNRIAESLNSRGIINRNITTNFEVEMPHEIYLADFFTQNGNKKIKNVILKDMVIGNNKLSYHGYGLINYKQDNTDIILESDLMSESSIRNVNIICQDGTKINANYIVYDNNFNIIHKGLVEVVKDNISEKYVYEEDDNMYLCLKEYVNEFASSKNLLSRKLEILSFSQFIDLCITKGKEENQNE